MWWLDQHTLQCVQMNLFCLQKHHIVKIHLTSAGTFIKQQKLQPFIPSSKRIYVVFIVLWSQTLKTVQLPPCDSNLTISPCWCSKLGWLVHYPADGQFKIGMWFPRQLFIGSLVWLVLSLLTMGHRVSHRYLSTWILTWATLTQCPQQPKSPSLGHPGPLHLHNRLLVYHGNVILRGLVYAAAGVIKPWAFWHILALTLDFWCTMVLTLVDAGVNLGFLPYTSANLLDLILSAYMVIMMWTQCV